MRRTKIAVSDVLPMTDNNQKRNMAISGRSSLRKPMSIRLWIAVCMILVLTTATSFVDASELFLNDGNNNNKDVASHHQEDDRQLQSNVNRVVESSPCIPAAEVKSIYLNASDSRLTVGSPSVSKDCFQRYNFCGSTMSPSACCRVSFDLGWVVCDSGNGFGSAGMACVCNENTYSPPVPTISPRPTQPPTNPTAGPTVMPTAQPTVQPTPQPTLPPPTNPPTEPPATPAPINMPTDPPTERQTAEPTDTPTSLPTSLPVEDPTAPPTRTTEAPVETAAPTGSPIATGIVETPMDPPVASPAASPVASPLAVAAPTEPPINSSGGGGGGTISTEFVTENTVDGEFVRQTQCEQDPPVPSNVQTSIFEYAYEAVPDPEVDARSGRFVNMMTDFQHNAMASEFFTCDYSTNALWRMQSALHKISSEPCANNPDPTCVVMTAKIRILVYDASGDETAEERGGGGGGGTRTRKARVLQAAAAEEFADDMLLFVENGMANGEFVIEDLTTEMSYGGGEILQLTAAPTESPTIPVILTTTAPSATVGTVSPTTGWTDGNVSGGGGGGGTVGNIQEGNSGQQASKNKSGLSPSYIATIAVASALVLLVILMVANRRRRRNMRDNDEYLAKAATTLEVDQLELDSPPTNSVASLGGFDSTGNNNRDPIILTSYSDLQLYDDDDSEDPFTAISPSRTSRTRRGPLTSQDELERNTSFKADDTVVGSHRGGYSETTPRSYPVQDTVDL